MTIARAHLIDPSQKHWYHCVTRCVRRAFLLGDDEFNRKEWIETRLKELADCFAVGLGRFRGNEQSFACAATPRPGRHRGLIG